MKGVFYLGLSDQVVHVELPRSVAGAQRVESWKKALWHQVPEIVEQNLFSIHCLKIIDEAAEVVLGDDELLNFDGDSDGSSSKSDVTSRAKSEIVYRVISDTAGAFCLMKAIWEANGGKCQTGSSVTTVEKAFARTVARQYGKSALKNFRLPDDLKDMFQVACKWQWKRFGFSWERRQNDGDTNNATGGGPQDHPPEDDDLSDRDDDDGGYENNSGNALISDKRVEFMRGDVEGFPHGIMRFGNYDSENVEFCEDRNVWETERWDYVYGDSFAVDCRVNEPTYGTVLYIRDNYYKGPYFYCSNVRIFLQNIERFTFGQMHCYSKKMTALRSQADEISGQVAGALDDEFGMRTHPCPRGFFDEGDDDVVYVAIKRTQLRKECDRCYGELWRHVCLDGYSITHSIYDRIILCCFWALRTNCPRNKKRWQQFFVKPLCWWIGARLLHWVVLRLLFWNGFSFKHFYEYEYDLRTYEFAPDIRILFWLDRAVQMIAFMSLVMEVLRFADRGCQDMRKLVKEPLLYLAGATVVYAFLLQTQLYASLLKTELEYVLNAVQMYVEMALGLYVVAFVIFLFENFHGAYV